MSRLATPYAADVWRVSVHAPEVWKRVSAGRSRVRNQQPYIGERHRSYAHRPELNRARAITADRSRKGPGAQTLACGPALMRGTR
jgi:hypothetical protein